MTAAMLNMSFPIVKYTCSTNGVRSEVQVEASAATISG
jgi:hypothetical protein